MTLPFNFGRLRTIITQMDGVDTDAFRSLAEIVISQLPGGESEQMRRFLDIRLGHIEPTEDERRFLDPPSPRKRKDS